MARTTESISGGDNQQRLYGDQLWCVWSKVKSIGDQLVPRKKNMARKELGKRKKKSPSSLMKDMQVKINWNSIFILSEQERLNTHIFAKVHICHDPAIPPPHCTSCTSWESPGDLVKCRFWLQWVSKFNMNTDHLGTLLRSGLRFQGFSDIHMQKTDLVILLKADSGQPTYKEVFSLTNYEGMNIK